MSPEMGMRAAEAQPAIGVRLLDVQNHIAPSFDKSFAVVSGPSSVIAHRIHVS